VSDRTGKEASASRSLAGVEDPDGRPSGIKPSKLAAVSIDDNGTDFRDSYMALGDLYICAVRCGMEPGPYFEEVAEISSSDPNIERISMRNFLLRFEGSAYFGETVAPKLK
jgi:hypothetical protein